MTYIGACDTLYKTNVSSSFYNLTGKLIVGSLHKIHSWLTIVVA